MKEHKEPSTMSIWDNVKPKKRAPACTEVSLGPDGLELKLAWDDGHRASLSGRRLRQYCPCAECVEEWSGKRTYDPETIPAGTKVLELAQVGNYAVSFTFSDAHRTGIYNWEYLRELSQGGPVA